MGGQKLVIRIPYFLHQLPVVGSLADPFGFVVVACIGLFLLVPVGDFPLDFEKVGGHELEVVGFHELVLQLLVFLQPHSLHGYDSFQFKLSRCNAVQKCSLRSAPTQIY